MCPMLAREKSNATNTTNQDEPMHEDAMHDGDAMHDILEGVLQYKVKEMLKVFIWEEKYFSLEQLNDRIKNFDYGYYNDNNKPSTIAQQTLKGDKNSVKQKGL